MLIISLCVQFLAVVGVLTGWGLHQFTSIDGEKVDKLMYMSVCLFSVGIFIGVLGFLL